MVSKKREYCPDASKDMTYPLPLVPRPSTEPVVHHGSTAEEIIPHRCICGMCGQSGHNRRSCQNVK